MGIALEHLVHAEAAPTECLVGEAVDEDVGDLEQVHSFCRPASVESSTQRVRLPWLVSQSNISRRGRSCDTTLITAP